MSIFGNIMSKIFGRGSAEAAPAAPGTAGGGAPSPSARADAAASPSGGSSSGQGVDVEAVLKGMAAQSKQKLDYRHSIVDLMKLLDLDSSLASAQGTRQGASLHRRHEQFRRHERVAAQAGHAQARRERRQGAGRPEELGGVILGPRSGPEDLGPHRAPSRPAVLGSPPAAPAEDDVGRNAVGGSPATFLVPSRLAISRVPATAGHEPGP